MKENGVLVDDNKPSSSQSVAYLATVLGVESILLPVQADALEAPKPVEASNVVTPLTAPVVASATHAVMSSVIARGAVDARLVFVVEDAGCLEGEAGELLSKMILAMKQQPAEVLKLALAATLEKDLAQAQAQAQAQVQNQEQIQNQIQSQLQGEAFAVLGQAPRDAVVIFGSQTARLLLDGDGWAQGQWLEPRPGSRALVTSGVNEIMEHPELKRMVWDHLQMVMKTLR